MNNAPKTLVLTLKPPVEVALSDRTWGIGGDVWIRGRRLYGNDVPWVSMADLLVDRKTLCFVGLTFAIYPSDLWEPSRSVLENLDPKVVHYNDIGSRDAQLRYPGEVGLVHRCELLWAPAADLAAMVAQLMCGQWICLYELGEGPLWSVPLAFGITDIDQILFDHGLTFPKVQFPNLDIRFTAQC